VTLYTALFSVGGISDVANLAFTCELDEELKLLGKKLEQLKEFN
jgi:hypothetical protein